MKFWDRMYLSQRSFYSLHLSVFWIFCDMCLVSVNVEYDMIYNTCFILSWLNSLQDTPSRVYTPLIRLSVCVFVCMCVTLFFEFFLCHKQWLHFEETKNYKMWQKTCFVFDNIFGWRWWQIIWEIIWVQKIQIGKNKHPSQAYPVELVNKNLTEAQPGIIL